MRDERTKRLVALVVQPSFFVLASSVVVLAFLAYPLFLGRVYTFSDLGSYHLPLRVFYRECLQQGLNFTWMPSILCGYYVHAEGQVGMYHPLHYFLYRYLTLESAFNVEFAISFPVMFLGMAVFLRRWRLPVSASLFGAAMFTFSGFNLLHSMHINTLQVMAHMPWLLALIDGAMRGRTRRSRRMSAVGVAVLTLSQWLLGFPQAVYFSALAEGPYALLMAGVLLRQGMELRAVASRLGWLLMAKTLGTITGAIQWVPTLDMLAESKRAEPTPRFSYSLSLDWRDLLQFIGPYFLGRELFVGRSMRPTAVEFGLYNGVVATVLTVWAVGRLRRVVRRQDSEVSSADGGRPDSAISTNILAGAALVFGLFILLMAFGDGTVVYPLVSKLPFLRSFRAPARHIVLVHFAMAILGAYAFADLLRRPGREPRRDLGMLLLSAWAPTGLLLMRFAPLWRAYGQSLAAPASWLISPALITLAILLTLAAARGHKAALIALIILAVVDQAAYGFRYVRSATPQSLSDFVTQFPSPPLLAGSRLFEPETNIHVPRNIDNCGGYIGVELLKRLKYDTAHLAALRLAGVRWATNVPGFSHQEPTWFELRNVLPRVRFVTQTLQSRDIARDIQAVDLAQTAFVTHPIELTDGVQGSILRTVSSPGYYRVETELPGRQLLIVSESYHEGWRATIDRKSRLVERVNGDFLGCVVEPGVHVIELRFEPESLIAGKRLTQGGAAALVCMLMTALFAPSSYGKNSNAEGVPSPNVL